MKIHLSTLTKLRLVVVAHMPLLFLGVLLISRVAHQLPGLDRLVVVGVLILVQSIALGLSICYWMFRIAPI